MNGINYITNEKGQKKAIVVDLDAFKKAQKSGKDLVEFLEDIEDLTDFALRADEPAVDYETVRTKKS